MVQGQRLMRGRRRHKIALGLTIAEAGEAMGLTHGAILYNIKQGHLKASRVGYRWYIKQGDLEEFIRDYYYQE